MPNNPQSGSDPSKTIIIGLSGPSSSGKTTLARLLRQIFNVSVSTDGEGKVTTRSIKLFILHEDDFYKTDTDIPLITVPPTSRALQDWDCIESLDIPLLSSTLRHVKDHGRLPATLMSKEDQNTVGESGVSEEMVEGYRRDVEGWVRSLSLAGNLVGDGSASDEEDRDMNVTICLFDGFLLYPDPTSPSESLKGEMVQLMFEVLGGRLFIPSTRAQTITRRNARKGYVTLEGFWEDPEGYVEDVVWPNFGRDHMWLFGGGGGGGDDDGMDTKGGEQVQKAIDEGVVDREVARENGIRVGPGRGEVHLREILPWAVERIKEAVGGDGSAAV